jgi:hypothetical protein
MKQLLAFEIDSSLIKGIHNSSEGVVIKLNDETLIFVTETKIGMFSKDTIDLHKGDFSKIDVSTLHFMQEDTLGHDSEAYITTH